MHIFTVIISQMVAINQTLLLLSNMKLHQGFRLAYLDLTLANSEDQLDLKKGVLPNFWLLVMGLL